MDFDPLSLFTPSVSKEDYIETNNTCDVNHNTYSDNKILVDFEDNNFQPVHVLDLPLLQMKPPAEVLLTFLKLLSPEEVYNFTKPESVNDEDKEIDTRKTFENKEITEELLDAALEWLINFCPRFNNKLKLSYLPYLSASLKKNYESQYNAWLTRIISSELPWVTDPELKRIISKEASLRLAENCGRTAQPEIIRKIALPNLSKYLKGTEYIKLKEPSLTNDNLGLKTWGSSLILANRLINKNKSGEEYLAGPVLELGSGTGLVGIVSSILGYETYLTDLIEIVPNLQDNVQLNDINANVDELNWCDPSSFTLKYGNDKKFNTIVLSDPIYSSKHPYWVVDMVEKFINCKNANSRVLIQIPLRPTFEDERSLLWELMNKNFLEIEHEIESGFDDFGEMGFCFKKFIRKTSI
ncbi:uncharacterized protein AC631_04757 [Debaryomyces fabryi]|uniref:Protein-lysine N-methyltransferase EFM2 n=1 Tax=Debaryomyces fabryi TaxID=58627 RepID=A0A0V1PTH9_9ASCO|nr:uncharacterized protein AC631_04757 [Debaryomyces fabryi]KRZ99471.1 hypothetical protein AC631_04757 [Debaryomyces fabryi]CUM50871.1 unnamed protein product [Debaryomyces fabryi]